MAGGFSYADITRCYWQPLQWLIWSDSCKSLLLATLKRAFVFSKY